MAQERLQKILARAGVASRRAAEALIAKGEVRLNGRIITELGAKADISKDRVELNGTRIVTEKPVFYVLNKPREVITTLSDPEGRPTIGDLLKRIPERVYPVGRLDFHTSGVLLLTNDGELAQALLHPTRGVPKAYVLKVKGQVALAKLEALRNGVTLDDGQATKPAELFVVREEKGNTWLQITITEGRNRQIHRMCEAVGLRVQRLSRVAFAGITVEGLHPGDYRELTVKELGKLDKDYRHPATRKRVDEARIRRYADAGFDLDIPTIVRAPRGPRRGNASTQLAAVKEARETERNERTERTTSRFSARTRGTAKRVDATSPGKPDLRQRFARGGKRDDATASAKPEPRLRFGRGGKRDEATTIAKPDPRQRFARGGKRDEATSSAKPDPRQRFARGGGKRNDATSSAARKDPRQGFKKGPRQGRNRADKKR